MNRNAKFGGAARRHFSAICEKPMGGGGHMPPPGRARVNLRPAEGLFEHPPLRFFADSKKTAARSAAGFHLPYPLSFWQL